MNRPLAKRLLTASLMVIPATALLTVFIVWQALNTLSEDLRVQIDQRLPKAIVEASVNLYDYHRLNDLLAQRINTDLSKLAPQNLLSPLTQCRARVLQLRGNPYTEALQPGAVDRHVLLDWQLGEQQESLTLGLDCKVNWPVALSLPFGLAMLALFIAAQILPPLPQGQRQIFDGLIASGISRDRALELSRQQRLYSPTKQQALKMLLEQGCEPLEALRSVSGRQLESADCLQWLELGLELLPGQCAAALDIAEAPPHLHFDTRQMRAWAHGIEISLPATPYFYYLWYARRRSAGHRYPHPPGDNEGWFVNPPSNRPDHDSAKELSELMESLGGHQKAINDLQEKGLRAKTLDQNRSKIKDEVTRLLGEQLAAPYLFELERDHRTARSKYRLAIAPQNIRIDSTAL